MTPELEAAYAEPHRRYHTRRHVEACLALLDEVQDLDAPQRRLLERALWWHDAVYDPRRADNEARSAARARLALTAEGWGEADIAEVERLVLLTAAHAAPAGDRLGALMVSIDLAVLGAPPAEYAAYAAGVRAEYAHVAQADFRAGRRAVLQRFLAAPAIYPDAAFRLRFEAPARENLAAELAALTAG